MISKAFKEWSYIVQALGSGRQSVILRKGGIIEDEGAFSIQSDAFYLFPTQYHQAKDLVQPAWVEQVDDVIFYSDKGIEINYFARLDSSYVVDNFDFLADTMFLHVWSPEVVKERFDRWVKSSVHFLLLRVYKLDKPFYLEDLPEYGGCKSWIDIDHTNMPEGKPVIEDEAFERIKVLIEERIKN